METSKKAPCLVLAFLRPEKTISLIELLISEGVLKIYLAVDGPRNAHEKSVQKTMVEGAKVVCSKNGIELHTWQRKTNYGLSISVLTALDWFFSNEVSGIILEDDLIPNSDFIRFCDISLNAFANDKDVWMVSGTQYFENENRSGVSWSNYPLIWGWATWDDRWKFVRKELFNSEIMLPPGIPLSVKNFWKTGRQRAFDSKIDSWAVPLAYLQRSKGGLTISPPRNLVSNHGVDSNATHTKNSTWYSNFEASSYPVSFEFPIIERNSNANANNVLLERNLYRIKIRNIFSYSAMKLFDFLRFRNAFPIISLEHRIKSITLNEKTKGVH